MEYLLLIKILIIFLLILLNGFFSGSEMSIISLRKGRLKVLSEEGDRRAQIITMFHGDPDRFFATVQIGVTLVGTFASVFAGDQLVNDVAPYIAMIPVPGIEKMAGDISVVLITLSIAYFTLVLGELVPKSVALNNAERFAMVVAYPLLILSRLFVGFTFILTFTSNQILRFFKDKTSFRESRFHTDEILHLLEEGVQSGSIEENEHEMIENVLEMNETTAREVMVPRVDVKAIPVDVSEEQLKKELQMDFSRLPVFKESVDHVIGIVHVKDLIRFMARDELIVVADMVRPAYYVPETMKIGAILKEMQARKLHMAIVVDEFGGTAGLLTMEDILEEIVGDIHDENERGGNAEIYLLRENMYMVQGGISISDFNAYLDEDLIPESDSYTSMAGYVIQLLGRFPDVGEKVEDEHFVFELIKRVRQKMVQFRIMRKIPSANNQSDTTNQ